MSAAHYIIKLVCSLTVGERAMLWLDEVSIVTNSSDLEHPCNKSATAIIMPVLEWGQEKKMEVTVKCRGSWVTFTYGWLHMG